VLNVCIRALDYCPPVDLTFGEYLRALITADMDLMPEDRHAYRVAFIEAFRRRGIYPRQGEVRTLSEDSLRWSRPEQFPGYDAEWVGPMLREFIEASGLRQYVEQARYLSDRKEAWVNERAFRAKLHGFISGYVEDRELFQQLTGLAFSQADVPEGVRVRTQQGAPVFSVHGVRESRRQKEDGRVLNQVFMTILQKAEVVDDPGGGGGKPWKMRAGSTLVIDLDTLTVRYVIKKGLRTAERLNRTRAFREMHDGAPLAATYFSPSNEPFAALHHVGA
jgi:hypothetical protein